MQDYDSANNVAWRASGTTLTSLSCDRASVPDARKTRFAYDQRNRLTTTTPGDGSAAIDRIYTPDGLIQTIWSDNRFWNYSYNRRRLLTQESLSFSGSTWKISHSHDANGHPSHLTYPDGAVVTYAPNALGEPTQISGYANNVSHHPNGAVAGYTLGNGIAYSLSQNARGLPLVNRHAGVLQDRYGYDENGNVNTIVDERENVASRTMGYDALNRLVWVNAPGIWGSASYTYDPLDNLRTSVVGSRNTTHSYDATNKLSLLNSNGSLTGFAYDANGNITGRGNQGYYFDLANRMKLALGKAGYAYDGWGRRATIDRTDGLYRHQLYSRTGKLLYDMSRQGASVWNTRYVHLGDKLIAETGSSSGTTYSHTDALGSPWAVTNAQGQVVRQTRYEPYGATAAGFNPGSAAQTGIGYIGHVNDADTGLVYMQQRYYDPIAGRFLSVDPVTTDASTGSLFNRYNYAYNNPYRFKDPDGRFGVAGFLAGAAFEALAQWSVTGSVSDWKAVGVAGAVGVVTGGVGGYAAKAALAGATTAGKAIAATGLTGGAAAAGGKHAEAALKGEAASAAEAGVAVAGGTLGAGAGAKIANSAAATLGKMAASKDGVVSGMAATTRGAINSGGPAAVSSTVGSEAAQKSIDAGVAVGQKMVEEKMK